MEDDSSDRDDTKRKSRNLSEKKRRDQFNSLVNDLSALISTSNRKMDKSTVLKSTIAFLKHHNEATDRSKVFEIQQDWKPSFLSNDEFTQLMLESLDGFIIVFGSQGPIFYTSDSITSQLGYLPCDLMKKTIFDLAYDVDHQMLLNVFLNHKPVIEPMQTDISSQNQITFFVHLKRGGINDQCIATTYELVKFVGYFRDDVNVEGESIKNTQSSMAGILQINAAKEIDKKLIFVGTGRLQMPQLIREITLSDPTRSEFTSKYSMEWKFLFLDDKAPPIIGYMPFEVLGTSGFDYYHFDDIDDIVACHEEMLQTGKGKSSYYRFLTKGQQWIWLQTDFCISYNQCNTKPDYVVCTNKVVNYKDVIRRKRKEQQNISTNNISTHKTKPPESVVRDLESSSSHLEPPIAATITTTTAMTTTPTMTANNRSFNLLGDIITSETSPILDDMWRNVSASACHINPLKSDFRSSFSYGNIGSSSASATNVKRKRYSFQYRGNESDSTSMSADSCTSKHSLMSHMSSGRQRLSSNMHQQNFNPSTSQHQNHSQQLQHTQQMPAQHNQLSQVITYNHQRHEQRQQQTVHQMSMQVNQSSTQQAHQKMLMLPQHSAEMAKVHDSCQYSQTHFPLRSSHIITPTFLEPPQYLTAIQVQPFPVGQVISPLPIQQNMLDAQVIITPNQSHVQEQLQRKHDELQKLIIQQQDELRIVSEQLLLARYTLLQPMVSDSYSTSMANNNRNYNYNSNTEQPHFNQYGFAMNTEEMQNQQDQQIMLQQQHNLHQQMEQNHAQQQQSAQQLQIAMMQSHTTNRQQQNSHAHSQLDQLILNRTVPDLDQFSQEEFDAFLNLSPLQSMDCSQRISNPLSSINNTNNINTNLANQNNRNNHSTNNPNNVNATNTNTNTNSLQDTPFSTNPNNSEDSLLSYMQMAAETSPVLNFPMDISGAAGSESQIEETKLLQATTSRQLTGTSGLIQPEDAQPQHRSPSFFASQNFQKLNAPAQNISISISSQNPSATTNPGESAVDTLATDLEAIIPYPLTPEQPQNFFNTNGSHLAGTS